MVRVETLIVYVDGLHELCQVVSFVGFTAKRFAAHRTAHVFIEPFLKTLAVKNMIAV